MSNIDYDFDYAIFGENMKKLRIEKGISQEALAESLLRSRRWVIEVEAGKSAPNLEDTVKICNELDCDMEYLFGRSKETRTIYKAVGDCLGLSETAARALESLKNSPKHPTISTLIEHLFTDTQINEETEKKEVVPSDVLLDLRDLCTADYGDPETIGYYNFNDVYDKKIHYPMSPREIFRIYEQRLYDNLRRFIKEERKRNGLPIYDEI